MTHYIEQSKNKVKIAVNASSYDKIIFTGNGCSGAVNHLIHCLDLRLKKHQTTPPDTVIFLSRAEHHSNFLPYCHLNVKLIYVPLLDTGLIDMSFLEKELRKHQRYPKIYVSFNAVSNVTGTIQNVDTICQLVHHYKGMIFFDYAAGAPYIPINMHKDDSQGMYMDAIFFSTHKFFGGPGSPGVLVANQSIFKNEIPYCPAGGTVRFVCPQFQTYSNNIEVKETGGTPDIIGSIKIGLIFDLKTRYQDFILKRDRFILTKVQKQLQTIHNLKLLNPVENLHRMPVFVFLINHIHYNLVVVLLNDLFGIQTRGGISCCSLLAQDLLHLNSEQQQHIYQQIITDKGVPSNYGWCRVSFHYSMPDFIIDYIIKAIIFVAQYAHYFKRVYKYYPEKNNWLYCPTGCPWDDFSQISLSLDSTETPSTIYLTPQILRDQFQVAMDIISDIQKYQRL